MKRSEFLSRLTNGLYNGNEVDRHSKFNSSYTLRCLIMKMIDNARIDDNKFNEWYKLEFNGYSGSKFCTSDDLIFIGRIDEGKNAIGVTFEEAFKLIK